MNLILLYLLAFLMLAVPILVLVFEALPLLFGAPYGPTDDKKISLLIKIIKNKKNTIIADLGSGDGRVIIALAKHGFTAHGYEVNPFLYLLTKYRIRKYSLQKKAFVHYKSFWNVSLSKYNVLFVFQINYIMPALEKKLVKELKKSSIIISNKWTFPNLKPKEKINDLTIYKI